MNDHQQSALKPGNIRTHTTNQNVKGLSPALQGATSAFLPKAPSTTTSLSSVSIPSLSTGAHHAARAVASQSLSPPAGLDINDFRKEPSSERGRALQPDDVNSRSKSRSTVSSQNATSPARLFPKEQSPSAIAARYASSRSSSPGKSSNLSPHRSENALATSPNDRLLTPDVSKALAGAIASMAARRIENEHQPLPVRSRILDFERIPQLSTLKSYSNSNHDDQTTPVVLRTAASSNNKTISAGRSWTTVRGRAQSASDIQPVNDLNGSSLLGSPISSPPVPDTITITKPQDHDKQQQRPPVPARLSHKSNGTSLHSAHGDDRTHRGLTVNGLADAMVASSLASSRAASPVKNPPMPGPRRRSRSFSALYDLTLKQETQQVHKPRKPPRPMKHTLRKRSEEEEEEVETVKRGRRHWVRKHPNKHHEGDRKRWRDQVTEPERKRYEGVFAANRGLFLGPGYFQPSPSALADKMVAGNKVANLIVRDLWDRSRLPSDILMEIYDLVAPTEERALSREQFVVGMWLIDQRLKGRKLPAKVSSSVWSSVRHPDGIKLKKNAM